MQLPFSSLSLSLFQTSLTLFTMKMTKLSQVLSEYATDDDEEEEEERDEDVFCIYFIESACDVNFIRLVQ